MDCQSCKVVSHCVRKRKLTMFFVVVLALQNEYFLDTSTRYPTTGFAAHSCIWSRKSEVALLFSHLVNTTGHALSRGCPTSRPLYKKRKVTRVRPGSNTPIRGGLN